MAALAAQTASEPVEIVVVDDGSEDANAVAAIVRETHGALLVRQSRRGPGAARNAGVCAASGAVVCLTDDDCEPEPTWTATMAEAVRAGGDVAAGEIVDDPRTRLEVASRVVTGSIATHGRTPFAASNNVAATARLFAEVPFDERYADAAGEDRDWCERLSVRGYRIVRTGATVVHRQQPTLGGYLSRHARYGRGSYRYHRTRGRSLERPGFYVGLLRDGFREGPAVGVLVAVAQLATAFGYAREALARAR